MKCACRSIIPVRRLTSALATIVHSELAGLRYFFLQPSLPTFQDHWEDNAFAGRGIYELESLLQ